MSDPTIYIIDYDPRWPQLFEEERTRILDVIGDRVTAIEHVGSTSIPGIAAKPVIDMAIGVSDIGKASRRSGRLPISDTVALVRAASRIASSSKGRGTAKTFLALTVSAGRTRSTCMTQRHEEWARHLAFRDYLRTHNDLRDEYEALKRRLAVEYAGDIEAYADAKSEFVEHILKLAGAPERTWVWEL